MLQEIVTLTPFWAILLLFLAVTSGHAYRKNWKAEGPLWKAWAFGLIAAFSLLALAFIPLA